MTKEIDAAKARVTQAVEAVATALQDLYAAGGQGGLKHLVVVSYATEVHDGPAAGPWKYTSIGMACTCAACQLGLAMGFSRTLAQHCAEAKEEDQSTTAQAH